MNIPLTQRIENLYRQSHTSLVTYAHQWTKDQVDAEELVSQLYEYLLARGSEKLYWEDSINIRYCQRFIHSTFVNNTKKMNKFVFRNDIDLIDGPAYDEQYDLDVDQAVRDVMKELEQVSKTSLWARGGIFQLYMLSDKTLEQVATDTGISKSTVLLSVKRIKEHLTARIKRPIRRTEEELL